MTAVVGVLCKDGVVLGTDSSMTFTAGPQLHTIEQRTEKLEVIEDHVIIAGTGSAGLGQRFCTVVKQAWNGQVFKKSPLEIAKTLSRSTIEDFNHTYLRPGQYGALVAFPAENHKPQLCEFQIADFQPELKTEKLWYSSMGITQTITDSFLALMREVYWSGPPSVQDGVFAVTWTLEHAVMVNPGGVNGPIRVAILETGKTGKLKARFLPDEELDEHRQNIQEAKGRLRDFRKEHLAPTPAGIPDVPKP